LADEIDPPVEEDEADEPAFEMPDIPGMEGFEPQFEDMDLD